MEKSTPMKPMSASEIAIHSVGLPPERHADRVTAAMMRKLAADYPLALQKIRSIVAASSDGSPKAQRKMQERIERAGYPSILKPGKRGQYELRTNIFIGWNPESDESILADMRIPTKPWIACSIVRVKSDGRGKGKTDFDALPILFITHHAISRAAQRLGLSTVD